MFTFSSRFCDEHPTIILTIYCLTLLLWIYFVLSDVLKLCIDQNRCDNALPPEKPKSSKIFGKSICKNIAWINSVPFECNRFSTTLVHPLTWKGFANKPLRMQFENTGNDVRMTAIYETGNIPFISSDAFGAKFSFKAIRFLCNHRKSSKIQHPIEMCSTNVAKRTIEMEMQLLGENENHPMPIRFLIFSWFFVLANKSKNYSLEPLIKCLKYIRQPNTMKTIKKPFPLDRIVFESAGNYYGYTKCATQHSDTNESYHQLIEANRLIPIGITQMREFHKLAHHIECAVNKSIRIENHSSNAHHQINGKEFEQNEKADRCQCDEQQAHHSAIQSIYV